MAPCMLCPRLCGADREIGERGVCGQDGQIRVARASLHLFEEPPISGKRGSGTVFFVGCSLRCVFCQNREISRAEEVGRVFSVGGLAELFLSLQERGAHNINLVTPTHFSDQIVRALDSVRHKLTIPVIYNSSGYERVESLRALEGLVDVYLPDFKYMDPALSGRLSAAPDYAAVASQALCEMARQVGTPILETDRESGCSLMRRGMIVRHLVLPGCRKDSMAVLSHLAALLPKDSFLISLMSQYTPEFASDCADKNLHRRLTRFEYESVVSHAAALGLDGFTQELASASSCFTPDFGRFFGEE